MREQLADGDAFLVRTRPRREIPLNGRIEIDLVLLDELHHRRGHRDDFGERGHVPHRAVCRRWGAGPVEMSGAVFRQNAIVRPDDGERAGERAVGDGAIERGAHRVVQRRIAR